MPTQEEMFEEYGRPEAYPAPRALDLLGQHDVDQENVQAFLYYSREMADAFTNNGTSEAGRRFLGVRPVPDRTGCWVAAFELGMGDGEALAAQQISNDEFRRQ